MEESQALCTKPKEVEAPCKESAGVKRANATEEAKGIKSCLLYTSPSPRD